MERPAVWRFGAATIALVFVAACWNTASPSPVQPVANSTAPAAIAADDRTASYWCAISESGYDYPPFQCAIQNAMGTYRLVKLTGSQRFTGTIRFEAGGGFAFHGKFFCPYGGCDQPLDGVFQPARGGGLTGTFSNSDIKVSLTRVSDHDLADGSFGGHSYGGFGGATYGGNSYGGGTIPRP